MLEIPKASQITPNKINNQRAALTIFGVILYIGDTFSAGPSSTNLRQSFLFLSWCLVLYRLLILIQFPAGYRIEDSVNRKNLVTIIKLELDYNDELRYDPEINEKLDNHTIIKQINQNESWWRKLFP